MRGFGWIWGFTWGCAGGTRSGGVLWVQEAGVGVTSAAGVA